MATIFVTEEAYRTAKALSLSTGKSMSQIITDVLMAVQDSETATVIEEARPVERVLTLGEKARIAKRIAMERMKGRYATYTEAEGEQKLR